MSWTLESLERRLAKSWLRRREPDDWVSGKKKGKVPNGAISLIIEKLFTFLAFDGRSMRLDAGSDAESG